MNTTRTFWSDSKYRLLAFLFALLLPFTVTAFAQEEAQDDEDEIEEEATIIEEDEVDDSAVDISTREDIEEEIIVTGSRLKRTTFDSIAPLQVIDADGSREAGLIDTADILQESTAASGTQIDVTFTGYVLDNGPGASTISLRGLNSDRTLVLINGRRVAPAGVEGAPSSPDLNLVPGVLVQSYELLLDGASSVYGSDAIAGVANAILRKDFDGWEVNTFLTHSLHPGTSDGSLAITWGRNWDRGFIGLAGVVNKQEAVTFDAAPWTGGCSRHAEVDENGNLRTEDLWWEVLYKMPVLDDGCRIGSLAARIAVPINATGRSISIYRTEGTSNGGWPNYSRPYWNWVFDGTPIIPDADEDGKADQHFRDYDLNGRRGHRTLYPELERKNFMAYGEYTLEGIYNLTPFFEIVWAERSSLLNSGGGQLFETVPALNPFNICNPDAEGGIDCGLAFDDWINRPAFRKAALEAVGCDTGQTGIWDPASGYCDISLFWNVIGPRATTPIVSVQGDRNMTDVTVSQTRIVGGVQADLPFLDVGSLFDWSAEFSVLYTTSTGESHRYGVREDRLKYALGAFSSTNTPCENDLGEELDADATAGCVPINLFAASLFPYGEDTVSGDFATQAERDYVMDDRNFDTDIYQTLMSYYMTGTLFNLPAGGVAAGIGVDHRIDEIESIPGKVAREGLLWGFFSDGGATGKKSTTETFTEFEFPILSGQTLAEEVTLNLSGRLTNDEFYGTEGTWSAKLGWRPASYFLIRATTGTSYRAPNLRNLFLEGQTGFTSVHDPCLIPEDALDFNLNYLPEQDKRKEHVLENCLNSGIDPTTAYNPFSPGFNTYSVEISQGGNEDLGEEYSETSTVGFVWEQPFTESFDFSVGVNYYTVQVLDSIIEAGPYVVFDCYNTRHPPSRYCDHITRDPDNLISVIRSDFVNIDEELTRGADINIFIRDSLTIFDRPVNVAIDIVSHKLIERYTVNNTGDMPQRTHYTSRTAYHRWKHRFNISAAMYDFRLSWTTRYLASTENEGSIDKFSDINGTADTCLGPPTDVLCRDIGHIDRYFLHSLSLNYRDDRLGMTVGIRNVLDQEPPFVDGSEVFSFNNAPIGAGYNLLGRSIFASVAYNFGFGE